MRKRCDSKVSHLEDCEEVQIISRVWNVLFREAEAKEKKKVERKNLNFSSCLKKKGVWIWACLQGAESNLVEMATEEGNMFA